MNYVFLLFNFCLMIFLTNNGFNFIAFSIEENPCICTIFIFFIKFNKSFSENIFIYSSNNFIFINLLTPFMINAITVSKEDILI